jgi:hypothetical protein
MARSLVDATGRFVRSGEDPAPVRASFLLQGRTQIEMALDQLDLGKPIDALLRFLLSARSSEQLEALTDALNDLDLPSLLTYGPTSATSAQSSLDEFLIARIDSLTSERIPRLVHRNNDLEWGLHYAFDAFKGSLGAMYRAGISNSVECIAEIFSTAELIFRALPLVEYAIRVLERSGPASAALLLIRANAAARAGKYDVVERTIEILENDRPRDHISPERLSVQVTIANLRNAVGDTSGTEAAIDLAAGLGKQLYAPTTVADFLLSAIEWSSISREAINRWVDEARRLYLDDGNVIGAAKATRLKANDALTPADRQDLCAAAYQMLAGVPGVRAEFERIECLLLAAFVACQDADFALTEQLADRALAESRNLGITHHAIRGHTLRYWAHTQRDEPTAAQRDRYQLGLLLAGLDSDPGREESDTATLAYWWSAIGLDPEARQLFRLQMSEALRDGDSASVISWASALALSLAAEIDPAVEDPAAASGLTEAMVVGPSVFRFRAERRWSLRSPGDRGLIYEKFLGESFGWLRTAIKAKDWKLALEISELGRASWLAQVLAHSGASPDLLTSGVSDQAGILPAGPTSVAALLAQAQRVEETVARVFERPGYVALDGDALRARIPPDLDTLVLEGWPDTVTDDRIAVLTSIWLPAGGGQPIVREMPLSPRHQRWLASLVARRSLDSSGVFMLRDRNHPWRHELASLLMPPELIAAIRGDNVTRVAIVPAGRLWTVPFGALDPLGDGSYLLEHSIISLLPSVGLFGAPRWTETSWPRPAPGFAYFADDVAGVDRERAALQSGRLQEAFTVDLLADSDALLTSLCSSNRLGVIGAHGDDSPGLLHSIASKPDRLTALDVLGRWAPETLVLGSCWSGAVGFRRGWEPLGLPVAALLKGAKNVVVGIGEIPASSSGGLLAATYQGLADGIGAPEALRNAQLQFLSENPAKTPWHWAGLTVLSRADD